MGKGPSGKSPSGKGPSPKGPSGGATSGKSSSGGLFGGNKNKTTKDSPSTPDRIKDRLSLDGRNEREQRKLDEKERRDLLKRRKRGEVDADGDPLRPQDKHRTESKTNGAGPAVVELNRDGTTTTKGGATSGNKVSKKKNKKGQRSPLKPSVQEDADTGMDDEPPSARNLIGNKGHRAQDHVRSGGPNVVSLKPKHTAEEQPAEAATSGNDTTEQDSDMSNNGLDNPYMRMVDPSSPDRLRHTLREAADTAQADAARHDDEAQELKQQAMAASDKVGMSVTYEDLMKRSAEAAETASNRRAQAAEYASSAQRVRSK